MSTATDPQALSLARHFLGRRGAVVAAGRAEAADTAACLTTMRHGSKTFFLAARLLPRATVADFAAIYAFCREADDAVDLARDPAAAARGLLLRLAAIARAARTGDAAHGHPEAQIAALPAASDRALARVLYVRQLRLAPLEALLEGFVWDAEGRTYPRVRDTLAYCARAAGSVGVLLAELVGVREPWALGRAADMGVAMQLTNICRDVGEDARRGRVYLPADWLREAGVDFATLGLRPTHGPALAQVVARVLRLADAHYARARQGLPALPLGTRLAVTAAQRLYQDIGRNVAAAGFDAVNRRAVVPVPRKAWSLARAVAEAPWLPWRRPSPRRTRPASPTSAFLLRPSTQAAGAS